MISLSLQAFSAPLHPRKGVALKRCQLWLRDLQTYHIRHTRMLEVSGIGM